MNQVFILFRIFKYLLKCWKASTFFQCFFRISCLFLWKMLSCSVYQEVASSWSSSQQSVKQQEWEALPSVRQWSSAGNGWCALHKSEAVSLLASLHLYHSLWSWALGSDRKNATAETSGGMRFLWRVTGLSIRHRVKNSIIWEGFRLELQLGCPYLEMIQASDKDAPSVPSGYIEEDWGRPRTSWKDCVSHLAWERLGVLPD